MSSASGVSPSSVIAGSRLMTSIPLLRVTFTVLQTRQPADECLSCGNQHKPMSVPGFCWFRWHSADQMCTDLQHAGCAALQAAPQVFALLRLDDMVAGHIQALACTQVPQVYD